MRAISVPRTGTTSLLDRGTGSGAMIDALFNWFDERLGISGSGRKMLNKIFPDHWSFLIGEIALYSFIVLLGTGVFLTLYFVPSSKEVIYEGSYRAASRTAGLRGLRLDTELELCRTRRPAHAPDAPLVGEHLRGLDRRPHAPHLLHRGVPQAPTSSTGSWARRCSSSRSSTASSAIRSPTTSSRERASGSPSRSWSRFPSSAATRPSSSSAATSRATRSSRGSSSSTCWSCPR